MHFTLPKGWLCQEKQSRQEKTFINLLTKQKIKTKLSSGNKSTNNAGKIPLEKLS